MLQQITITYHLYLGASTSYQRSNMNSLQAGSKLAGHLADEQVVCMHVYWKVILDSCSTFNCALVLCVYLTKIFVYLPVWSKVKAFLH